MFWNSEFLDSSPSHIDVLLQLQTVKLSDILFEEDLLQELKTSNVNLANFLNRPEIIAELVDNITQITEEDCSDKLLYSRVHAAYISCEILTGGSSEIFAALMNHPESLNKIISCLTASPTPKVVPQKAALISKLISTIHSLAPANLSCHITQDIDSFSKLIDLLVQKIDVSGSLEILSTFIKRTTPPELRYVFCEALSKLNFVFKLIDVMTLSDIEDKQRNACQLLCDIVVIGRQEASEQTDSGPMAQDMLEELLESKQAVHVILNQMFSENMRNATAIVCGMKLLQTLLEQKPSSDVQLYAKTIEQTQEEIEKHLVNFHELLLNPPKQEPIKTTFGIIQKPLGYMRLEVVNLIRALISTNSPIIIRKLVELKTMKVIIDLFIEYSWNNLLHTQVEQALCLIINNNRHDEELHYQLDMLQQEQQEHENGLEHDQPEQQQKQEQENGQQEQPEQENKTEHERDQPEHQLQKQEKEHQKQEQLQPGKGQEEQQAQPEKDKQDKQLEPPASRALLSQLFNECDLICRLLMPNNSNISKSNSTENTDNTDNPDTIDTNNTDTSTNTNTDTSTNTNTNNSDSSINSNNHNHTNNNNNNNNGNNNNNTNSSIITATTTNGRQANFGHIIQMINSISINRDLDIIKDHLDEMKEKRPDLHDRWNTFVNVDVVSFKEISLFFDAQSASNNVVNHRYGQSQHHNQMNNNNQHNNNSNHMNCSTDNSNNGDEFIAYLSFARETVIPTINVDVLPKTRRSLPYK